MAVQSNELRPKKRGRLRLAAGKWCYTAARYGLWYLGRVRFARTRSQDLLPCEAFAHRTPLLRKLRDVDMWYQYNKIVNLRLAAARLDGVLVRPGETFSYWRCVGKPSKRRGYVPGMVLENGKFGPGIGGGLCQMANLIYWMTLHTPLTVVERYRHGYDVFPDAGRTQPFGSGATCVYPYRDLMIRNDTPEAYQLCVRVGERDLEGAWRTEHPLDCTYEIVERGHRMQREYWGGFSRHNELYRRRYDRATGAFLDEEYVTENHALMMYDPFLPEGSGDG